MWAEIQLALCSPRGVPGTVRWAPGEGPCCFASFIGQIYVYNYTRLSAATKLMFNCHPIVCVKMGALEHLQIFYGK